MKNQFLSPDGPYYENPPEQTAASRLWLSTVRKSRHWQKSSAKRSTAQMQPGWPEFYMISENTAGGFRTC